MSAALTLYCRPQVRGRASAALLASEEDDEAGEDQARKQLDRGKDEGETPSCRCAELEQRRARGCASTDGPRWASATPGPSAGAGRAMRDGSRRSADMAVDGQCCKDGQLKMSWRGSAPALAAAPEVAERTSSFMNQLPKQATPLRSGMLHYRRTREHPPVTQSTPGG